jgi:hypothetical protein
MRMQVGASKALFGTAGVGVGVLLIVGILTLPVAIFCSSALMVANLTAEMLKNTYNFATKLKNKSKKKKELNVVREKLQEEMRDIVDASAPTSVDDIDKNLNFLSIRKKDKKSAKQELEEATKEALYAERDKAFSIAELSTVLLTFTGASLGLAAYLTTAFAIVGLSIATMGMAALVLGLVGLSLAIAVKVFQFIDERYDYKLTQAIRNWFRSTFNLEKKDEYKEAKEAKKTAGKHLNSWLYVRSVLGFDAPAPAGNVANVVANVGVPPANPGAQVNPGLQQVLVNPAQPLQPQSSSVQPSQPQPNPAVQSQPNLVGQPGQINNQGSNLVLQPQSQPNLVLQPQPAQQSQPNLVVQSGQAKNTVNNKALTRSPSFGSLISKVKGQNNQISVINNQAPQNNPNQAPQNNQASRITRRNSTGTI